MGMKVFASGQNFGAVTLGGGDVTQKFTALYVGGTGDVAIKSMGADVVFVGVQGGTILPVKGDTVDDGSTTATSLVWLDW